MASQLQGIAQTDFSGGLNIVTNPYLLSKKQIWRVRNMILDEHGSLRTRDGATTYSTSPGTNAILAMDAMTFTDGNTRLFAVTSLAGSNGGNTVYTFNNSSAAWTSYTSASTLELLPQFINVNDQVVWLNGYETPFVVGKDLVFRRMTAGAGQTVPPGAKHGIFHLGSLWLWNTSQISTALDGPSSLRMSDANNIASWANANQTFVDKEDGQVGMGMSTFTLVEAGIPPTATLVLFKNYNAYAVTGVFGASNYSLQRIKSDMGCIAPRTIQFVSGFGIIRLTHKGFALYNGVDDRLISEEVRPLVFGRDGFQSLDQRNIALSWAAQSQNPPLYVCACPVAGPSLTRIFIYDLIRRSWTICDFPTAFQSLALLEFSSVDGFSNTTVLLAGSAAVSSGSAKIYSLFVGATDDDGTAINWSFRTAPAFVGAPTRFAFWRRFLIDLTFFPNQTVTNVVTINGLPSLITQTNTLSLQAAATTLPAVYGTSTYAGDTTVDGRTDVDIGVVGPSVYADVSGTGIVKIRSVEWQARAKPLTKALV